MIDLLASVKPFKFYNYCAHSKERNIKSTYLEIMADVFVTDKDHHNIDFKETVLERGEYEACQFTNCDFSNTDLSGTKFIDCRFAGCNLSVAKLVTTVFQDVCFKDCKLLGLRFDQCSKFGLSFSLDNCQLNHSSFAGARLKGIHIIDSQLHEVDFTDCDLTDAVLTNCDLYKAVFDNTILLKADFRAAFNYSIDPETNRIKGAQFSLPQVTGLLNKYGIKIEGYGQD